MISSTRGKLTEQDIETLRKYGTKIKTDSIETRMDNRFESIDIGGPFDQPTAPSPESLSKIYVCSRHTDDLREHHSDQLRQPRLSAAGGPPSEVQEYLGYVKLARKQGDSFEEGIATALEAVLVSPKFLYRIEREQPAVAGRSCGSRQRVRTGLAPFLFPVEQHARCGTAATPRDWADFTSPPS